MTAPWLMKTAIAPAISSAGNRHETTCSRAYHCSSANASCSEFSKRGASNGIHSAAMNAAVSSSSVRPSVLHSNGMADLLSTSIEVAVGAPELGALPRPVGEFVETALDDGEVRRLGHAVVRGDRSRRAPSPAGPDAGDRRRGWRSARLRRCRARAAPPDGATSSAARHRAPPSARTRRATLRGSATPAPATASRRRAPE